MSKNKVQFQKGIIRCNQTVYRGRDVKSEFL